MIMVSLGTGSTAESDDFVAVNTPWTEKGEAVMSLTASGNMSYVITDKYNLYGWGQNANSQLGNGSMENVLTPELWQKTWLMLTQVKRIQLS